MRGEDVTEITQVPRQLAEQRERTRQACKDLEAAEMNNGMVARMNGEVIYYSASDEYWVGFTVTHPDYPEDPNFTFIRWIEDLVEWDRITWEGKRPPETYYGIRAANCIHAIRSGSYK